MKSDKTGYPIRRVKAPLQAHFSKNARVEVERSLRYWFSALEGTGKKSGKQATLDRWIECRGESDV
jgi:hypothetical protein